MDKSELDEARALWRVGYFRFHIMEPYDIERHSLEQLGAVGEVGFYDETVTIPGGTYDIDSFLSAAEIVRKKVALVRKLRGGRKRPFLAMGVQGSR